MKTKTLYLILLVTLLASACSAGIVATDQTDDELAIQSAEIPSIETEDEQVITGEEAAPGEEPGQGQAPEGRTPPEEAIEACENESDPVAGSGACEFISLDEPEGWKDADFDDSGWSSATVHSVNDVGPKDGYDEIGWDASVELIWGPDLETNNTILCRVTVQAP